MNKEQASQEALDQLYQESGAPQFFATLFWIAFAATLFYIIYRVSKSRANKRKVQEDILSELRKLNKKEQESNLN